MQDIPPLSSIAKQLMRETMNDEVEHQLNSLIKAPEQFHRFDQKAGGEPS